MHGLVHGAGCGAGGVDGWEGDLCVGCVVGGGGGVKGDGGVEGVEMGVVGVVVGDEGGLGEVEGC